MDLQYAKNLRGRIMHDPPPQRFFGRWCLNSAISCRSGRSAPLIAGRGGDDRLRNRLFKDRGRGFPAGGHAGIQRLQGAEDFLAVLSRGHPGS